ncbi:MAG: choice-of-anchor J domain-containing protein [Prevotella sp.]|nr:choice-of-anchor J domain-containing protein [Prevotella sp.]
MKKKTKLLAAALSMMIGLPAAAQDSGVTINGSLIDWYYYGKDLHGNTEGWNQQTTGMGTEANPYNYGLISLGVNPDAATKKLRVADFPIRNYVLYSNSGGVYTGDAYYSFFMHEKDYEGNIGDTEYGSETYEVVIRKWTWDEGYQNVKYTEVARRSFQPIDLTYDPLYDVVYGIFLDGDAYKIGTLDMTTFTVKYISREAISGFPRCIAINSKGELYLIDSSGYVYKVIDMTDGTLQTVGSVGFKSQNRMMSATFDLRTDKLYWLGYSNNGKIEGAGTSGTNETRSVADGGRDTGLYEVNTETGEATLIGMTDFTDVELQYDSDGELIGSKTNIYGKMQLTGIYVDGCFEKRDVDMVVSLQSAPMQLKAGQQGQATVTVRNIGKQRVLAKDYVVRLYANGQLVATIDRDNDTDPVENLNAGDRQTLTIPFTAPAKAGQLTLYAEVVNAADQELRNNKSSEASVVVISDKLLPQVVLKGDVQGAGIALSWEAPDGHITDGAEEYAAFTYDGLGEWTMYDGDKGYTQKPGSWNSSILYANWNTPKAFIVFDPDEAGIYLTESANMFRPHSGQQYFAAWMTAVPDDSETGGHQIANDDYMISPELSGQAQTITFWARGYKGSVATGYETEANYTELMRVLYTTGDGLDPTTGYEVAVDTFVVNNLAWTQYTAQLPAGAKHFALQCCSQEGFVLMIDDIEFQSKAQTATGYKVYRDGVEVATLGAAELSYQVARTAPSAVFTVTALYGDEESAPSNAISVDIINGIDNLTLSDTPASATAIYNLRGQRVSTAAGRLPKGLYIVGGKKVVVK